MKREDFKKLGISRTDSFYVDPKEIVIKWNDNPREDYGDPDQWQEFKTSIKNEGVRVPIDVCYDPDKEELRLAHGFRRMKAVTELMKEGVEFDKIRINIVENNSDEILFAHLTLNGEKALNDAEKAVVLSALEKRGFDPKDIAERTGINLSKVYTLLEFEKKAGKKLKNALAEGEVRISTAKKIIKRAGSVENQEKILQTVRSKSVSDTPNKPSRIIARDLEEEKEAPLSPKEKELTAKLETAINVLTEIMAIKSNGDPANAYLSAIDRAKHGLEEIAKAGSESQITKKREAYAQKVYQH